MEKFYYTFLFDGDPNIVREAARKTSGITIDNPRSGSFGLQLEADSMETRIKFYQKVAEIRNTKRVPI